MSNRIKMRKQLGVLAVGLLVLIGFQNCAGQKFSSMPVPVTLTGGPNCREQLNQIVTPVELVFVVDVSGSNADDKNPTDLNKKMRSGSISTFYETYKAKTNFEWSMITFAEDKAPVQLKMGDAIAMKQMITDFMSIPDYGNTPYALALRSTTDLITGHTTRLANTKYIVLFMSDGKPNPAIADADLESSVKDVVGALPGEVTLNTLYYGPTDAEASGRLRKMAQTGGGNFLDTNANPTGNSFLISDLIVIPGVICD